MEASSQDVKEFKAGSFTILILLPFLFILPVKIQLNQIVFLLNELIYIFNPSIFI